MPLTFFAPKYWGTWIGLAFLRFFSMFPYSWLLKLNTIIGRMLFHIAKKRRKIIQTNIELCFPEKTVLEKKQLVQGAFNSTSMALFETALSWWGKSKTLMKLYTIDGIEHLHTAAAKNKGVILLGSHFTTLEIAGAFVYEHVNNLKIVYKRSNNLLLEWFIRKRRLENCSGLIKHKNLFEIVRNIKNRNVVFYAPDQDFGSKDSIFVPFMGVMTSTLLSTQRLAKITGAPVVPLYVERVKHQPGYIIHFSPALENFPSGNNEHDAIAINQAIEKQIRKTPEQYLWAHRRFKSRPPGEADVYSKQ